MTLLQFVAAPTLELPSLTQPASTLHCNDGADKLSTEAYLVSSGMPDARTEFRRSQKHVNLAGRTGLDLRKMPKQIC